ncbi:MAG: hypothetical protein IJ520_00180 [Synergistaceae bacterium]|nr:hypothetical protein [Synergistaceae bacterium]MBQ8691546.1 hypothetical protein [Synergistaceae bacterium]
MNTAILDERLMASIFKPESQDNLDEIIEEAIRKCPQSGLNRVEKLKNFMCTCASHKVEIFADFDSAGRISVFLSDKDLEQRLRCDTWLEADILTAMAKDIPEIEIFLKGLSEGVLKHIEQRKAIPVDLVPELQNFENECAKYNISIWAGYDDFYKTKPVVFLSVPDYRNFNIMSKLQAWLRARPKLERALHFLHS